MHPYNVVVELIHDDGTTTYYETSVAGVDGTAACKLATTMSTIVEETLKLPIPLTDVVYCARTDLYQIETNPQHAALKRSLRSNSDNPSNSNR